MKLLFIAQGEETSLQYHNRKNEFVTIIQGEGTVSLMTQAGIMLRKVDPKDDGIFIPAGMIHRYSAITTLTLLEMCVGEDKDIVRIEDKYGRVKSE